MLQLAAAYLPMAVRDEVVKIIKATVVFLGKEEVVRQLFGPQSIIEVKSGPFRGLGGFSQQLVSNESGVVRAILLIEFFGKQHLALPIEQIALKWFVSELTPPFFL